jgi:3-hydroxymyristoyl/3-hydroxydecanoyl-(acyl carrier protein) dehydratase
LTDTAYCIADALMYADGKPIVEITDMSVRLTGLTRQIVEELWNNRSVLMTSMSHQNTSAMSNSHYDRRPALFDTDRITAFAIGKPSDAFGDRYRIFDSERTIARLPGPPFQFLDRIVSISGCEPWVLRAGGEVVAQYDIPPDAWYFAANRQFRMPFAVLLETALQPCGWLAAYVGSALTSETDLSFRNLGGTATQFRDVTPSSGTLTTTVKMTRVSNSGGMIIQHYDFDLRCDDEPVYVGNTYFGFFSKASLANQIGIRDTKPFVPSTEDLTQARSFLYIDSAPFADSQFQMIDDVQVSHENGPFGQGFAIGTTVVDPSSWFFKAHFYQDPVVPGSLGLESFFQLLKLYAAYRWQLDENAEFVTPVVTSHSSAIDPKHEWVYRGQVVPRDQRVTVSAVIKQVDDANRELTAEGYLSVDGRVIYQMKNFSLGCV